MNILFISHDGSRSGAPFVLLHLCRWFKNNLGNKGLSMDFLFLEGGPLVPNFRECSNSVSIKDSSLGLAKRTIRKIAPSIYKKYIGDKHLRNHYNKDYSVIYANSIASLNDAIELKKRLEIPLILHLHELSLTIDYFHKDLKNTQKYVDCFICVSQAVAKNAIENFGVSRDKVKVVYEFVDFENLKDSIKNLPTMGKRKDDFIVCASGTLNSRKNPDTFIQVARIVKTRLPKNNIKFIWIGASEGSVLRAIELDIKKLKNNPPIEFIEQTDNPFVHFDGADVFLMTSKEDPFPLVCIEAGYLGKPIICFDNAGGIPEMLAEGGGKVVDYLDNEAMADAVIEYYSDRDMLARDGKYIQNKVQEYDVSNQAQRIWDIIKEVSGQNQ